jgi:hypothetical protein
MKNLANCKPSEFLKQTNRIRHHVQEWMDITKIPDIRKRLPQIPDGATAEDKKKLMREQSMKNLNAMLDSAMEDFPEKTIEVLALCCFIPVEEADEHPVDEYLQAMSELMESEGVIRFFTSLVSVAQKNMT